tara:strand:+ start:976 stop:1425 length:450 start_codon:yes stop_codon:yes gene_type:complete
MIQFMFKVFFNYKKFSIFLFLLFISFAKHTLSNEIKPLQEILDDKNINNNSINIMSRCAAIYGALYFINPSDTNSKEYENRYKIFLQSAVLEDIKINNTDEEESYKKQIEEFKTSIKFFIQIYIQNYKKNNSYLKNHWLENDFNICEKF